MITGLALAWIAPSAGFARNPSAKAGHKNSVATHAGTHPAEKLMAEK
jgi:hypothetical protein